MNVATYEGIIEDGKVKLDSGVRLPDHTRVYVIVPEQKPERVFRMMSPRLVNPGDAALFKKEVLDLNGNKLPE